MHLFAEAEFWVLLAVVLFIIGVWKPAARWITGALDARAARIRDELEAARRLREEAQQLLAANQKREAAAAAEAEAIITHARAEAERITAQAARDLEQTLERRQRLAEERIAQEQAKALAEIRRVAVDVAISAARQVITAELD
ncbi:MAG: F0F1 ATP synthase subunit B, partial [Alphaproteobacteria bacterium]|nr:F0F1 ATP synthase subunit B [Alphaproteobacteria bacterium]